MSLLKDLHDLDENGKVGDWCFYNDDQDMFLCYPHCTTPGVPEPLLPPEFEAPKDIVHLYLSTSEHPNPKTPAWKWDGNREAPTLSPSINVIDRWHGYLKAGKLETA
jgi:hypothetical protein